MFCLWSGKKCIEHFLYFNVDLHNPSIVMYKPIFVAIGLMKLTREGWTLFDQIILLSFLGTSWFGLAAPVVFGVPLALSSDDLFFLRLNMISKSRFCSVKKHQESVECGSFLKCKWLHPYPPLGSGSCHRTDDKMCALVLVSTNQ